MQIGQMEVLQEEDWSRMVGWPPLHTFSCSPPPLIQLVLWTGWVCVSSSYSKGKGNHCKSHSLPYASFWQDRRGVNCGEVGVFGVFIFSVPTLCLCADQLGGFTWAPPLSFSPPLQFDRIFIQINFSSLTRSFWQQHQPKPPPSALLDWRSGDEGGFYAFLPDLDWNTLRLRWGHFLKVRSAQLFIDPRLIEVFIFYFYECTFPH